MLTYGLTWRPHTDNIGDDLTTLAAMQHLPRVDHVLDADALDAPLPGFTDDDRLVLLAHGIFLRASSHWPPERHIAPVCAGVHISEEDAWGLPLNTLDGAGFDALAACGPIAARDVRTANRLAKLGIPHTLSGCLALTLTHPPYEAQRCYLLRRAGGGRHHHPGIPAGRNRPHPRNQRSLPRF